MLFKMGVQASTVCLCCSCWCVKWNSGSWAGLGPSLYLPPSDYFTPLIFLPPPLIWEDHWKERVRQRETGLGGGTEWPSSKIQRLRAEPWVAMLPLSPLIYDWDPCCTHKPCFVNPYRWRPNLSYPNMLRCRKMKLYLINASPSHGLGRRLHLLHIIVCFFHGLICVDLTALRKCIHEFLKCLFYFHLAVHLWDSTSSPGI